MEVVGLAPEVLELASEVEVGGGDVEGVDLKREAVALVISGRRIVLSPLPSSDMVTVMLSETVVEYALVVVGLMVMPDCVILADVKLLMKEDVGL